MDLGQGTGIVGTLYKWNSIINICDLVLHSDSIKYNLILIFFFFSVLINFYNFYKTGHFFSIHFLDVGCPH